MRTNKREAQFWIRLLRMTNWKTVSAGIDRFVLWTKESAVLSGAAKVALRSIPVIGDTLADIYDESKAPEADGALILEILARIEAVGASGFEQSTDALRLARDAQQDARTTLEAANKKLGKISDDLRSIRADMAAISASLERLEAEIRDIAWGATEFDISSPADRAAILVLLKSSLTRSRNILDEQSRIANEIIRRSKQKIPKDLHGKDDALWWLSKNDLISLSDRTRFRELRAVTDRMKDVNLRVRWLVRSYGESLLDRETATCLVDHLSTWLLKHEYLREHDDEHMALIFVGVKPTSMPFPTGVDTRVANALQESMKVARLEHIT